MLAIDIDEIDKTLSPSWLLGFSWYNPIRIVSNDYVKKSHNDDPDLLKQRIKNKVLGLGGDWQGNKIMMLVQARCLGVYFSPANFYFCYNKENECQYMLAEVSNTPWHERHYYLVDLQLGDKSLVTEKNFHVSPFMNLDMNYHWTIRSPQEHHDNLLIHIENHINNEPNNKLFDATLQLKKQTLTAKNLWHVWLSLPAMTIKICAGIYYQALKLFIKKVPFVPYQKKRIE